MKAHLYIFEYATKTCSFKRISYYAFTFTSAMKRFRKNTCWIELFNAWRTN